MKLIIPNNFVPFTTTSFHFLQENLFLIQNLFILFIFLGISNFFFYRYVLYILGLSGYLLGIIIKKKKKKKKQQQQQQLHNIEPFPYKKKINTFFFFLFMHLKFCTRIVPVQKKKKKKKLLMGLGSKK